MAVEDVQQLLDLLALSPEVTELSVHSSSGNKVTIKRQVIVTPLVAASPDVERDLSYALSEETGLTVTPSQAATITATMVGLFHEVNPPILSGTTIVLGQIVGYIESMRLMNEIVSTVEGVVDVVIASDGQPVEYGQPLFALTGKS